MRETFKHHYTRPDDTDLSTALHDALVVLDANVLLGLYRASPQLRETRLSVLRRVGERLFAPYQAVAEFHRNRRAVIEDLGREYRRVREALSSLEKAGKSFASNGSYAESASEVKQTVQDAIDDLRKRLDALQEGDPHRIDPGADPVLESLEALLEGRVGRRPSPKQIAKRVDEFVSVRVPLGLPPGFEDAHKLVNRPAAHAAGDYLLWREVLREARRRDLDVLLVTDDSKDDWWLQGGVGVPTVPHPDLISEFEAVTGRRYFQLKSAEFLTRAGAVLEVEVTDDDVAEEQAIADVAASRDDQARQALSGLAALDAARREAMLAAAAGIDLSALRTGAFDALSATELGALSRSGARMSGLSNDLMAAYRSSLAGANLSGLRAAQDEILGRGVLGGLSRAQTKDLSRTLSGLSGLGLTPLQRQTLATIGAASLADISSALAAAARPSVERVDESAPEPEA